MRRLTPAIIVTRVVAIVTRALHGARGRDVSPRLLLRGGRFPHLAGIGGTSAGGPLRQRPQFPSPHKPFVSTADRSLAWSAIARLRNEIRAVEERDPAARNGALEILLTPPGLHAQWAYRLAHALWRC